MALADRKPGNGHTAKRIIISDDNGVDGAGTDASAENPVYRPHLPHTPTVASTGKEPLSPSVSTARDTLAELEAASQQILASQKQIDNLIKKLKHDNINNKTINCQTSVPPRLECISALFADLPDGHDGQISELEAINRVYRQELAERLAPAVNAHIQAMPHDTYEEKKILAKWVNTKVEQFGLAVKCPKTGLQAKLRAHPGNWPKIGRFAFEVYLDGKRTIPSTSDKLPTLQLMDVIPSQEAETPWQDTVGGKATQRDHKLT